MPRESVFGELLFETPSVSVWADPDAFFVRYFCIHGVEGDEFRAMVLESLHRFSGGWIVMDNLRRFLG